VRGRTQKEFTTIVGIKEQQTVATLLDSETITVFDVTPVAEVLGAKYPVYISIRAEERP
jgi:hypothetical protein